MVPPCVVGSIGPHRSLWMSSRGSLALVAGWWNSCLCCFPSKHPSHTPTVVLDFMTIPSTYLVSFLTLSSSRWPIRWCQMLISSSGVIFSVTCAAYANASVGVLSRKRPPATLTELATRVSLWKILRLYPCVIRVSNPCVVLPE